MDQEQPRTGVEKYSASELLTRKLYFFGCAALGFVMIGATLLLPLAMHSYAYLAAGAAFAVAVQQVWPWLSGEIDSRTTKSTDLF